jgi:anthranilate phosphoribosyltransferase
VAENQRILAAVLQGAGTPAQRDVVVLNTALVLWVSGRSASVADGVALARAALVEGRPWQQLQALVRSLGPAG